LKKEKYMETIIAGRFETLAAAQQAEAMLIGREFSEEDICSFALNPPGQHATYPTGGDEYADDNSRSAGSRAVIGGAVGGAIGLGAGLAVATAIPPAGIAAVVVAAATGAGAYTGSLAGALNGMGAEQQTTPVNAEDPRPAGVMVAVRVEGQPAMRSAQETLQETGATGVEITTGTWRDGAWVDFQPQSSPTSLP
jgi:hypothetical protein